MEGQRIKWKQCYNRQAVQTQHLPKEVEIEEDFQIFTTYMEFWRITFLKLSAWQTRVGYSMSIYIQWCVCVCVTYIMMGTTDLNKVK